MEIIIGIILIGFGLQAFVLLISLFQVLVLTLFPGKDHLATKTKLSPLTLKFMRMNKEVWKK